MARKGILGTKLGMTQVFDENNRVVPVTVVKAGPNVVTRVRTPEKVNAGKLPEPGKWTQLKIDIAKLGLKPGMKIDGFAFTQFDGTVYWDRLAISHRIEEAKDVQWSFKF